MQNSEKKSGFNSLFQNIKDMFSLSKDSPLWGVIILFVILAPIKKALYWYNLEPYSIRDYSSAVLQWNQLLLHIPAAIMFYMIFVKRWAWRGLSLSILAAWFVANYALIDLDLHKILNEYRLYPKMWNMQSGDTNSNYAKVMFYMAIVPLFLVRFFQKEYRTMDRYMTLFMAAATLTTSVLFHWTWIEREYKLAMAREQQHLYRVIKLKDKNFMASCAASDWFCWRGKNPEKFENIPDSVLSEMTKTHVLHYMKDPRCADKGCIFISGGIQPTLNEFTPSAVSVAFDKETGFWRVIVDKKYISYQFLEIRRSLTTMGVFSCSVWIYGIILVWSLHQIAFKRRARREKILEKRIADSRGEK